MQRDLQALENRQFDLLVIGGGMFGAAAVLDAAQRGLSVALVEKGDFGGATSAHSYKMIHGGIRYLQHGDIYRVRQSAAARSGFLRVAPHLSHPLPIVIPTYGSFGMKSKPVLWAGIRAYDAITFDRNRGIADPSRHIPNGWFLSRDEVARRYPGVAREGLTGAGVFCDGQMYNPTRLVLAHIRSAVELGAVAANYAQAVDVLRSGNVVHGAVIEDGIGGNRVEVKARMVLNASGPYAGHFLERALGQGLQPKTPFSRDAYFIVPKPLIEGSHALTLPSKTVDPDARLSRGGRHLFLVPWRGVTLVGVWHKVFEGHPDTYEITDAELESWISEVNLAYPQAGLTLDDVAMGSAGLVPFGENDPNSEHLKFAHRSRIVDHAKTDGLEGLLTLIGVRYTTGPYEAARLIGQIASRLGHDGSKSRLAWSPVHGGDFESFDALVDDIVKKGLPRTTAEALAHNHGQAWREVLDAGGAVAALPNSHVLECEIEHAVRFEMAQTLGDIVFRRTDLLTHGLVSDGALDKAAEIAAKTANWTPQRLETERQFVKDRLAIGRTGRTMLADRLPQLEPIPA